MDNRDHFLSTNFSQAMAWQTLPPVPEQSMDSFFNPSYDHSVISSILKENIPNYAKPMPVNHNLVPISADPGFSERAARLSPFGSRSFNGRTSQMGLENVELGGLESNGVFGNLKLGRVSSAHSLRSDFSQTQVEFRPVIGSSTSPNEGSSVSQQFLETEEKFISDSNFRKRKAVSKGKSQKVVVDEKDDRESKRCKTSENKEIENNKGKKEEEANTKAPEPPKDYIHVRARRGQATDSHSLAERVRREKISERMKLLQDLVPGCNKVTGKALMLDEIINYVQSLQCQVEFLSMKLASVDTFENSTGSLLPKDVTNSTYQIDSPSLFGQQNQEFHQPETNFSNEPMTNSSLDPPDTTLCSDIGLQLPFIDEFAQGFPQISGSYEDDLQSIVQMGFGNNPTMEL